MGGFRISSTKKLGHQPLLCGVTGSLSVLRRAKNCFRYELCRAATFFKMPSFQAKRKHLKHLSYGEQSGLTRRGTVT
jgi:hypothetical protein